MLTLIDDLKLYQSVITDSFDRLVTVQECAQRLKQSGFQFDDTDLIPRSRFLEAIKSVLLEAAWTGNEHIRDAQFTTEFILIAGGAQKPSRKSLVLLISVLDSAMDPKSHANKISSDLLSGVLTRIQTDWPALLSWLPSNYLNYVDNVIKISTSGAP